MRKSIHKFLAFALVICMLVPMFAACGNKDDETPLSWEATAEQVIPLEIKAGTSGKMKSLRYFMEKKQLKYAIRSSLENFARLENDGIDIIPLYALSNLFRE